MAEKARKKSKKVRNLIIGLVVLLLLAAALVVLLLTTSAPEEEAESSAYESTLVDLVVSEADDINELTVENAGGGFDIIRVSEATEDEDAVYGIEELESFLTDESELSSIIDQFANVSAMRLIEENAPDIAKYGLDDPTYVVTTYYDDGTTHTFTVGDILPTDNGAYMMFDDDPNVYSMGDTKMSRLDYTALDFMDLNVIDEWESYTDDDGNEVTAPTIEYLQVTGGTLEDVFRMEPIDTEEESSLASSYGSTYRIVSPIESDFRVKTNAEGGDDNAIYTTGLQSLEALSVAAINPTEEDMAAYGLDEPYCTIEFSRDGTEHTWLVGAALTTEDGTAAHYFYSEDQPVIYVVADSDLPWISMEDGAFSFTGWEGISYLFNKDSEGAILFAGYLQMIEDFNFAGGEMIANVCRTACRYIVEYGIIVYAAFLVLSIPLLLSITGKISGKGWHRFASWMSFIVALILFGVFCWITGFSSITIWFLLGAAANLVRCLFLAFYKGKKLKGGLE